MTLPKKKSRNIEIDGIQYRYLISNKNDILSLSVEILENPRQLLQAFFTPHNSYKKDSAKKWKKSHQGVAITPKLVRKTIKYGLANGWNPSKKNTAVFELYTWEINSLIPQLPTLNSDEKRVKDISIEQVSDLRFDLSLDPNWRKKLFNADVGKKFLLPSDYFSLSQEVKDCGLSFSVFNAGWTDYGFIIFAIESVEFPDVAMCTVNNPEII